MSVKIQTVSFNGDKQQHDTFQSNIPDQRQKPSSLYGTRHQFISSNLYGNKSTLPGTSQ